MKRTPWLIVTCGLLGVSELMSQSGSVPITPVDPTLRVVLPAPPTPGAASQARLVNLSTRARVTTTAPVITGFAINGTASRPVLVRAAGPSLSAFGVAGTLGAPHLELRAADGTLVAENTGWRDAASLAGAFASAGAFPFARGSADSAVVATLAPGTYTVQVSDAAGGNGGVALAEIYDLGTPTSDSRLVNVSTRTTVAAGGGELISGFVLSGTAPRQFLLRGVGPSLSKFGVSDALGNLVLTLFDSSGRLVAANDHWSGGTYAVYTNSNGGFGGLFPGDNGASVNTASATSGAFALSPNSNDAALVTTLSPGAYTVQVASGIVVGSSGFGSTTSGSTLTLKLAPAAPGTALLEIYEVP